MARKYNLITELYRETLKDITSSQSAWLKFLQSACRNYKCRFDEKVLIYAQRPDAKAVLEIERWNKLFGRWVNRGSSGIAVFDDEHNGRSRLKYYFDISDTHESRFSRPVSIWELKEEHEDEVIEALENSFGELEEKGNLDSILKSVVSNVIEDNYQDYLEELIPLCEDSFLEELDERSISVLFREALNESLFCMLSTRCLSEELSEDYQLGADFSTVMNFNTLATINTLGTAVSDMSEMVLKEIALTIRNINKREQKKNRTFVKDPKNEYSLGAEKEQEKKQRKEEIQERSGNDEHNLQQTGGLQSTQPITTTGGTRSSWEIRFDAPQIPKRESQSGIHQPTDIGETKRPLNEHRAKSIGEGETDNRADGESTGNDRADESRRPDEMGGTHEQHSPSSTRNDFERTDLRLEDSKKADDQELPAFLDENFIKGIITNKSDDLVYKKSQIELFFSLHNDVLERAEYLKSAYQESYTEIYVTGKRVGYKPEEDGLLMWEGSYLSRSAESVFSWGVVAEFTAQLIEKKEYAINTDTKIPRSQSSQQLSLFDMPTLDGESQMSFFRGFEPSAQLIDEVLCLGGNEPKSMERICAYFAKDYPLEQNAEFLRNEYGQDGKGVFFESTPISLWFDTEGIRIAKGKDTRGNQASILSWNNAAQRIRELLDMGRYAPAEVVEKSAENEREDIAESLWHLVQDFSDEARERNDLMPTIHKVYGSSGGFPEETKQIATLLLDTSTIETITTEVENFTEEYRENPQLLRFHFHRANEIIAKLQGLQRPQIAFQAQTDVVYEPKQFITNDEMDALIIGGSGVSGGKYRIYSYFLENHTVKEKADFLKQEYGTGGRGSLGFHENHDSKGLEYSRGSIRTPYDKVLLKWNQVTKRIDTLIKQERYMSEKELAYIPTYEQEEIAASIYSFFHYVPQEQPRPYPYGFDYHDAVPVIKEQLSDKAKVDEIYQMMLPVWESMAQDDRHYNSRQKTFENLTAYRECTFSLFGEIKEPRAEPVTESTIEPIVESIIEPVREPISEDIAITDIPIQPSEQEVADVISDELQIGTRLSIDDRDFVIDSMNHEWNKVSLQDITFQSGAGFPIFRSESIDFVRAVLKEQNEKHILPTEKEILAPPRAKRERIYFTDLYPDIPKEERHNFRITNPELGVGTLSEKYEANIAAIRILKELEERERLATPKEQEILSKYVGWGGLSNCFEDTHMKNGELKNRLTEEEYAAARESTLTAFYTSPIIIKAMYAALEQMGFRSGNVLEPSCGVGNFIGMIPDSMRESKAYGIELDSISGRIAKQLYQNSSIAVNGFEKIEIPDSFFDVAVGNVPFGNFKVLDQRYDKNKWLIHDYFFGKTLDKVRPGGIVAFVTSKGTMDKANSSIRKYLAQRADLIGAIRLPNNAFKNNAGTKVTSDIIFLQKRDRMVDITPDWIHLDTDANGIHMNSYFVKNPDMILGEMVMESTRFGMDSTCKGYEDIELSEQLGEAILNLHANIGTYEIDDLEDLGDEEDLSISADPSVRNFSYTIVKGKLYFRENSRMHPVELSVTAENRIRGMIALRDQVRELIMYQTEDYPDEMIQSGQEELNRLYDEYTRKYGLLCSRGNRLAFGDDSSYCLLCSLEISDEEGNLKRKADMFTKRTIKAHTPVTKVDTASEALAVSISEKARVDMQYMSELSGQSEQELELKLKGVIFRNIICPINVDEISKVYFDMEHYDLVTADEYLSGNVRKKLQMVKALEKALPAEEKIKIKDTIIALETVQPTELNASEISVRIGATWVKAEIYKQFMFELFDTGHNGKRHMNVMYSEFLGKWHISKKGSDYENIKATTTYGTKRMSAYYIFEQTLNLKDVRVFDTIMEDGKEKKVLNKKETAIAQDRQELIKSKFSEWIWKDLDRREMLCEIYNEKFNSIRQREYDGQHITFQGINPEISFRKHQINGIARGLYGGNSLLAHCVGAGKTYTMIAIAMEAKRLGLCNKSLVVVPNHLTEQWAAEWLQLYPAANILVSTKRDFEMKNRKRFCARISTGEYDAIIIGHSQLEKIPMSKERQEIILEQQINELILSIENARGEKAERYTIKQMERKKKSMKNRLAKLNDQSRKDDVVTFEELGVDKIFIDESHYYKNLFLVTKMRNVAGISQTEAQKSSDLFMKCQYLNEVTGNKGVVFATGTPISNSMVELYTIQRYLQYETLQEAGMQHFDEWAANFGETVTAIELSPEGTGYRAKTRFAKFYNLPELMAMFREVADIQTADMLNLPVPKANFHTEVIKPSTLQKQMVAGLAERAEAIRSGRVDPSIDNMLKITSDGRKLALDVRLINPLAMDDEESKVSVCAKKVHKLWQESSAKRLTQLVFCDLSTPSKSKPIEMEETEQGHFEMIQEQFINVYEDLKSKLVAKGIPSKEIAFIHEASTEVRKKKLFEKVRLGQIRVLMGSTQKMGAGTNVQDKLLALHDLDCPWRPSDLEQRSGRIVRQGNQNSEVHISRYVTEGTFDSYLYQLVENKQKFISQIMTSKVIPRMAEDVDTTALNYAEIKALATGNPMIIEKSNLDMEVGKLTMLKANHLSQKYALEEMVIRKYPESITRLTERVKGYEQDILLVKGHPKLPEVFAPMEIFGVVHTEKESAGKAILDACTKMTGSDAVFLGKYRGFAMTLAYERVSNEYRLSLKGELSHTAVLGADIYGNLTRLDNVLEGFTVKYTGMKEELDNTKVQLENARSEMEAPFPREAELKEKTAKLSELNILLNLEEKDKSMIDTEPEQREEPVKNVADKER